MIDLEQLQAHVDRIRASNVLGRSELMNRLFEFFVTCSLNSKTPKEIEIAVDVFGKDAQFEVTQDAMVRVYIHKLRRKLEDYYASTGREESWRLIIPRGEYRLVFEEVAQSRPTVVDSEAVVADADAAMDAAAEILNAETAASLTKSRRWLPLALAAGALLLIANIAIWFFIGRGTTTTTDMMAVRQNEVWQPIVSDNQPITVVLGDYYIFGELDAPSAAEPESVRRLVREFNINSRNDLDRVVKERPELADRYMDLALRYLPVSSAYALSNIMPMLQSVDGKARRVQLTLASDLTPEMIRSSHVIYIGLLSGMGILRDIVFAGSQFKIGDTYDELIDQKHNKVYVSQSSVAIYDNTRYRDYGYFSTFAGPNGKRIVVLAGTRDVALMHTAEAVTRAVPLQHLVQQANTTQNFEALYAVDAIDHMNLDGQLLLANKLDTQRIWAGNAATATAAATAPVKTAAAY